MFNERTCCPVCNGDDTVEVYRCLYRDDPVKSYLFNYYKLEEFFSQDDWRTRVGDTPYEVRECKSCNCVFQKFTPDESLSAEVYGGWIGRNPPKKYPLSEHTHYIAEAMKLTAVALRRTQKTSPGDLDVLDFGMGRGVFTQALKACGCNVWGFDLADDRQAAAEESGIRTISLRDIGNTKFDFINTEQVYEHLPNPSETTAHLSRALKQNGLLKISVPFCRWVEKGDFAIKWQASRYAKHSPMPYAPLEHLNYYRRPCLETLGRRHGLMKASLSVADELRYSFNWIDPRAGLRNIARATVRDRFRNYVLLQKAANDARK